LTIKIWHGPSDPQKVLQQHCWELLDCLHHHARCYSTSLGPNSLPSRASIPGGVRGSTQKMLKRLQPPKPQTFSLAQQVVTMHQVWNQHNPEQLLSPSH
jgi:hypothetical protein